MINVGKYNVARLLHFSCNAVATVIKESETDRPRALVFQTLARQSLKKKN